MTKILVVEDNLINQELVLEILDAIGFTARGAKDGYEAINMSEKEHYDLVIMDIELPGMDGIQVKNIIKSKPAYKNVPVIALTAYSMKGDKDKFLAAGFDDYVPKPIDIPGFTKKLDKYK